MDSLAAVKKIEKTIENMKKTIEDAKNLLGDKISKKALLLLLKNDILKLRKKMPLAEQLKILNEVLKLDVPEYSYFYFLRKHAKVKKEDGEEEDEYEDKSEEEKDKEIRKNMFMDMKARIK